MPTNISAFPVAPVGLALGARPMKEFQCVTT